MLRVCWSGKGGILVAEAQLVVVCVKVHVDFELYDVCFVEGKL